MDNIYHNNMTEEDYEYVRQNYQQQEIKDLQKKSVRLEEAGNLEYKEVDKVIEDKVKLLNSKPIYQEYLRRMNEFNDVITESSNQIEKYINDKI